MMGIATTKYSKYTLRSILFNRIIKGIIVKNRDTVLIVEDEENLRYLLKMILEENGIKVLEAVNGMEAVKVFTTHQDEIEVVLSDLGLPLLGGWEAFVEMKKINPQLKGILASGYFNQNIRKDFINLGAKDFIPKPYNTLQIIKMVREALDEHRM
jgi:two-component system, cell cycle sensor histidine kinase and response regulator CckA